MRGREAGKNVDGGLGFYSTRTAEGTRDSVLSSYGRIGGSYKKLNGVVKGSPVGVREVCFSAAISGEAV